MRSWENSKGTFWRVFPSGQSVFLKNHHLEPETTIYTWLFQLDDSKSLYRKWLFHQTSMYKWFALGFQARVSSFATNIVHLDLWPFDARKSSKNRLPNGWCSGDLPWYHLKQIQDWKNCPAKTSSTPIQRHLAPNFAHNISKSPKNPRIKCANHMEAIKEDVSATPWSFARAIFRCYSSLKWSSTFLSFSVSLRN